MKPWITFQEKLQYSFKEPQILFEALTHKSFANERQKKTPEIFSHNERLEFLGDAVLDLAVSTLLMNGDFAASEGDLSKRRASLVNEAALAEVARELGIQEYIHLGQGELHSDGRNKNSILSSTFEAIIGGVYLDSNFNEAYKIIERLFVERIKNLPASSPFTKDYKTRLQEYIQAKFKSVPVYSVDKTEGPEHQKLFYVTVRYNDQILGAGKGKNRKEAEQDSARQALESVKE